MHSRAIVLGALLALMLPSSAAAKTIRLDWTATVVAPDGARMVRFRIATLELGRTGWSASVAMQNVSPLNLTLRREFALLVTRNPDTAAGTVVLSASRFAPAMPSALAIGQHWTGTIGGPGVPPAKRYLRIRLGTFRLEIAPQAGVARLDTRQAYRLS